MLLHYDQIKIDVFNQLIAKLHNQRIIAQKLSFCVVVTVISLAFHRIVRFNRLSLIVRWVMFKERVVKDEG